MKHLDCDVVLSLSALGGLNEQRPKRQRHTGHRKLIAHLACEDCSRQTQSRPAKTVLCRRSSTWSRSWHCCKCETGHDRLTAHLAGEEGCELQQEVKMHNKMGNGTGLKDLVMMLLISHRRSMACFAQCRLQQANDKTLGQWRRLRLCHKVSIKSPFLALLSLPSL